MSEHFRDWLCGRKMKKLWAARAFSGFVLLTMLVKEPDFFQANIMMSAGIAVMGSFRICRAHRPGRPLLKHFRLLCNPFFRR